MDCCEHWLGLWFSDLAHFFCPYTWLKSFDIFNIYWNNLVMFHVEVAAFVVLFILLSLSLIVELHALKKREGPVNHNSVGLLS